MRINSRCVECLIKREASFAYQINDEDKSLDYMNEVMRTLLESDKDATAPQMTSIFTKIYERYSGIGDAYTDEKRMSNLYMLDRIDSLRGQISRSDDRIIAALKLAVVGNYIDFGALSGNVSMEALDRLLDSAPKQPLAAGEYGSFLKDLDSAHRLLYITDNAGEIVADRLVIEEIKRRNPELDICAAVRGLPIQNDAMRQDASDIGLDRIARIVDSGTNIGGTVLSLISSEMLSEVKAADIIIAKGQGNFETLNGCGLNIYYLFMCKCQRFTDIFGVPELTGVLANEKRLPFNRIY
ncbi:MAG: damage-control phosphatase ARMT1 family protein [Oscillospiraceae bacterium]